MEVPSSEENQSHGAAGERGQGHLIPRDLAYNRLLLAHNGYLATFSGESG